MKNIVWHWGRCSVCKHPDVFVGPISMETNREMCQGCNEKEKDRRTGGRKVVTKVFKGSEKPVSAARETNSFVAAKEQVIAVTTTVTVTSVQQRSSQRDPCDKHHWVIDQNGIGRCRFCEEERQFAKSFGECLLPRHERPRGLSSMNLRRT